MDLSKWPGPLAQLYVGRGTLDQALAAAASPAAEMAMKQQCEAAFFVGEYILLKGNSTDAVPRLEQARDKCPKIFSEYIGAVSELHRLRNR